MSPAGRMLALKNGDGGYNLWDYEQEQAVRDFRRKETEMTCARFSPDGRRLLTGGANGTLYLWHVETGKLINSFPGHKFSVVSLQFSPDGEFANSSSFQVDRDAGRLGRRAWQGGYRIWRLSGASPTAAATTPAAADSDQDAKGWVDLFNGRDLSGWVNVNCRAETFSAHKGVLYCTGTPHGFIRTDQPYTNFVLDMEWRHLKKKGNSGLFIWSDADPKPGAVYPRSVEVQILDGRNSKTYTSHGDILAVYGATLVPDRPHPTGQMRCLPNRQMCRPAGEWNHYRVTCMDGVVKLAVNG